MHKEGGKRATSGQSHADFLRWKERAGTAGLATDQAGSHCAQLCFRSDGERAKGS